MHGRCWYFWLVLGYGSIVLVFGFPYYVAARLLGASYPLYFLTSLLSSSVSLIPPATRQCHNVRFAHLLREGGVGSWFLVAEWLELQIAPALLAHRNQSEMWTEITEFS